MRRWRWSPGVTVSAFEVVGSILVVAMLIVPAATAHLLTDRLPRMMLAASGVAVLSAVLGYRAAVAWNTSVSGMMAVAAGAQFALAVVVAPRHGLLGRAWNRLSLSLRIAREDVLAGLYRAEEAVDRALGLSPAEVRRRASAAAGPLAGALAIRQLHRSRLIDLELGDRVVLSDLGRASARRLVRAHRLWESYLDAHFDLPPDHLHEPAERVEHFLGPALLVALDASLHAPDADPHGRAIPPEEPGTA